MNIDVDKSAKAYAKQQITIDATPEKVFQTVSDINNWTKWQSSVSSSAIEGTPEVGRQFTWNANGMKITSKLHTVNPNIEFGWTGRIMWITAVHNWTFSAKSAKCIVTVEESLNGFLSGLMKKSLVEGMTRSLQDLKKYCEI